MRTTERPVDRLFRADPAAGGLLRESASLEEARTALYSYLNGRERALYTARRGAHLLDDAKARECVHVLKNVIARAMRPSPGSARSYTCARQVS